MFTSVLVANRGEIACRVFRTARRMGIRTIAVYSEADAKALHVREADEAVLIGPAAARESYLDAAKVLAAAKATGAEAIHPGYGFLSENADFAEAVMAAGLVWVGPPPAAIRAMGLKDAAKTLMIEAGVPVTPGYLGADQSLERLQEAADTIGYPVLIKAVAGGGGKGMKKVERPEDFADGLASAQREGQSSFGDPRVLIEKYITRPRHIEVQVFGDSHGTVVHLYERDCSLQRRHQKVIEEAPAPGMDAATRKAVTDAAVRAAQAVHYEGAGTIEFIADASDGLKADRIWFMEMNTRLQVEHPVTEARLYAEDPANGFMPSIGRLEHFRLPDDIRIDTGVEEGGEVSQFYDPMIAKLIVHAETREEAAGALAEACSEVEVWPIRTNAAFAMKCLEHPRFVSGDIDTGFIAAEEAELAADPLSAMGLEDAAHYLRTDAEPEVSEDPGSPWDGWNGSLGFRANAAAQTLQHLVVNGESRAVPMRDEAHAVISYLPLTDGAGVAFENGSAFEVRAFARAGAGGGSASDGALRAPMPGKIVATPVKAGDAVTKGQPVVVLEAMKMEHALVAPFDGVVGAVGFAVGEQVGADAVLATVEAGA